MLLHGLKCSFLYYVFHLSMHSKIPTTKVMSQWGSPMFSIWFFHRSKRLNWGPWSRIPVVKPIQRVGAPGKSPSCSLSLPQVTLEVAHPLSLGFCICLSSSSFQVRDGNCTPLVLLLRLQHAKEEGCPCQFQSLEFVAPLQLQAKLFPRLSLFAL